MLSCYICRKKFSFKRYLLIHSGVKPYACNICEKELKQQNKLTVQKRIHTGEKSYTCDTCKKSFIKNSDLTTHKMIHTGEKPFKCDTCEKAFRTNYQLTLHMRIHTGEKPYSCELCQKYFISGSKLSRHNVTARHLKKLESTNNTGPAPASTSFIDCGEADIKLEIKEEETLDEDPLFITTED